MWDTLKEDIQVVFQRDPAARSIWEVILTYPGFHALFYYRMSHSLWTSGLKSLGRLVSNIGRFYTGIEIHPGAKIGRRFFIDHGMGVVIGETAEIHDDVTIYQGVTLGGTSRSKEKRHPTVEDGVLIGVDATILGPVTIGRNAKIGAGSVVVNDVPADSTVVGIPGRVVVGEGVHLDAAHRIDLEHQRLPDPVAKAIGTLVDYVQKLEKRVNDLSARQGGLEVRQAEDNEVLRQVKELLKTQQVDR
ncbi:MAG TPA: serine O-acetyltransferase [Candidatus Binatia bacterium]|jgi:serine O-acetyltransferase